MTSATVLIVDDEPQIRRVLRTTLISTWIRGDRGANRDEALDLIRSEHVDLILLDINMPGRSGLEHAARFVRRATFRSSC